MPNYNTPIRYGEQGIGGNARIREGGGRGSGPHRKITRCRPMGRSRSQPPPAPDEISWFRPWGGQFISLECIRTDCLMEDQARGGGGGVTLPARSLGLAKMMDFTWLR